MLNEYGCMRRTHPESIRTHLVGVLMVAVGLAVGMVVGTAVLTAVAMVVVTVVVTVVELVGVLKRAMRRALVDGTRAITWWNESRYMSIRSVEA